MTLDSTFKTGYLGLVLGCYRYNIASSHGGSVGVGIVVGDVVIVELGWATVEVTGVVIVASIVVVVSSGLLVSSIGVEMVYLNMCTGAVLLDFVGSILVHHSALAVLMGLVYLSFHLDG